MLIKVALFASKKHYNSENFESMLHKECMKILGLNMFLALQNHEFLSLVIINFSPR